MISAALLCATLAAAPPGAPDRPAPSDTAHAAMPLGAPDRSAPSGTAAPAPSLEVDAALPHSAARRVFGNELTLSAGALGTAFDFQGGRWGDLFTTQAVEARWLLGGLTLEGSVMDALPVVSQTWGQSLTATARAGWTFDRLSFAVGAAANFAPTAHPVAQLLPSARVGYAFDRFALSAAVFDLHALALARVSVDVGSWGVGYLAPLGAEAHLRLPLTHRFGLRLQALAFRAGSAQVAFLSVGGSFLPEDAS